MLLTSLRILGMPEIEIASGETIIDEGKPGGKVMVLIEGTVEVFKSGEKVAEIDKPGNLLGETAMILGQNYGATVKTKDDCKFFEINNIYAFLRDNPDEALEVMKILCRRIESLNKQLTEALNK